MHVTSNSLFTNLANNPSTSPELITTTSYTEGSILIGQHSVLLHLHKQPSALSSRMQDNACTTPPLPATILTCAPTALNTEFQSKYMILYETTYKCP
jgi:hypothetical protein